MHHHISMITKNANTNNRFYRHILGLKRVMLTVNQDSPTMYHLFFGDKEGTPGTGITFFEIPMVGATHRGTNAITGFSFIVPSEESLSYWKKRFEQFNVTHGERTTYAGRPALPFEDEDGLRMHLIVSSDKEPFWEPVASAGVPEEHTLQGMGTVELTVSDKARLADTLTTVFGYDETTNNTFQQTTGSAVGELFVIEQQGPNEKPGRGSIHHLALRTKDEASLEKIMHHVRDKGFVSSNIIDRYFFKSIYFKEANGLLFEVATDGPGFTQDTDVDHLGEKLELPPFLEDRRQEIVAKLTKIEE